MTPCRSLLFAPADEPRRVATALASDADAVAIDLEDAVLDVRKAPAREAVVNVLRKTDPGTTDIMIRVNGVDSPWFYDDVGSLFDGG